MSHKSWVPVMATTVVPCCVRRVSPPGASECITGSVGDGTGRGSDLSFWTSPRLQRTSSICWSSATLATQWTVLSPHNGDSVAVRQWGRTSARCPTGGAPVMIASFLCACVSLLTPTTYRHFWNMKKSKQKQKQSNMNQNLQSKKS